MAQELNLDTREELLDFYSDWYNGFESLPGFSQEKTHLLRIKAELETKRLIPFNKSCSLVDIGCGIGFKTYILAPFFTKATGLDFIQKAVDTGTHLNPLPQVSFYRDDVFEPAGLYRGDVVSAIGLSVLNTADLSELSSRLQAIFGAYVEEEGTLWVLNPSNFSSSAPGGWYNHSVKELRNLKLMMESTGKFSVTQIFHHHFLRYYTADGGYWFLHRLSRLILGKSQLYSLIIRKK